MSKYNLNFQPPKIYKKTKRKFFSGKWILIIWKAKTSKIGKKISPSIPFFSQKQTIARILEHGFIHKPKGEDGGGSIEKLVNAVYPGLGISP